MQCSCYNHMMAENKQQIIAMLKNIKLFDGLDYAQLDHLASFIQPVSLGEGETVFLDGKNYPFFVVISGQVRYTELARGNKGENYILKQGDFFGADLVFRGRPRLFSAVALKPALLLSIQVEVLRPMLNTLPELTNNIKRQLAWYKLIRSKPFRWLGEEETVKVICRKHPAYLFVVELPPLAVAWFGILVILFASQIATASFRLATGLGK
jgi:signal-transduction protein with cAMP-binding, CBS, and nucleotidyltransferase domain